MLIVLKQVVNHLHFLNVVHGSWKYHRSSPAGSISLQLVLCAVRINWTVTGARRLRLAELQSKASRLGVEVAVTPRDFVKELNVRLFWSKKKKSPCCGNMLYIMNSLHNEAMMRSRINIRKLWYSRVCPDTREMGSHMFYSFPIYLCTFFFWWLQHQRA